MSTNRTPGYEVTNDGRVFSAESNWRGYGKRELSQSLNSYGYPSVRVVIGGKRKRLVVHVLVATKFIGEKPSPNHEVRHLDGNKMNNCVTNLAWGTSRENAADRELHGKTSRGKTHSAAIKNSNQKERVNAARAARTLRNQAKGLS